MRAMRGSTVLFGRGRTGRGMRRSAAWAGALALAAVTASACTSDVNTGAGSSATKPSASPTTSATGGTAENCDAAASSPAPSASAVDGADVQAIKQRGYIRVGVSADQYLTGYLNSAGAEEGFDIDLAHALAQSLFGDPGKARFVAISTADREMALQDDTVDVVIDTMTINCERLKDVAFSAVYFQASQRLLVAKGSPYTSIKSLDGEKVCAQQGSTSIDQITAAGATPAPVENVSDCLVKLQENAVSAISTDDTLLAGLAEQDPNLVVVGPKLEPEPYGIAMQLHKPDLEQWVNYVLAQYEADGGWEASYQKWFRDSLGAAQPPVAQYSH